MQAIAEPVSRLIDEFVKPRWSPYWVPEATAAVPRIRQVIDAFHEARLPVIYLAYRVDAGQLSAANRHITDVGPSYVVLSAIVIALACGGWLARTLAAVGLVVLVFPGQIFGGLSHIDVAAVGHLTAALTAAAATALILSRRRNPSRRTSRQNPCRRNPSRCQGPDEGSGGHVTDAHPDEVGDRDGAGAQDQLPDRAPPEWPLGQPGHHAPAGDRGDRGEPERDGQHI